MAIRIHRMSSGFPDLGIQPSAADQSCAQQAKHGGDHQQESYLDRTIAPESSQEINKTEYPPNGLGTTWSS
jgi:hypothetical protein